VQQRRTNSILIYFKKVRRLHTFSQSEKTHFSILAELPQELKIYSKKKETLPAVTRSLPGFLF
jgi:hypothetical protein